MTQLQTMYPGVANSPDTFLVEGLTIDGTVMYVADGTVFGEIPTLAVIGQAELAETVQVTGKQSDGGYTIVRGVEGRRKAWAKATNVARNWTNKDYEALRANVTAINDGKVDKIAGKGLSTHDYDDAAQAKVDAIPPNPKYTDTVPDLSPYAEKNEVKQQIADVKSELEQALESSEENLTEVDATLKNEIDKATRMAQEVQLFYVPKTDIINDLTTGGEGKVLSAEQGKTLEKNKLDKADVVNDLTTGGVDKALSAEQGKTLFTYADNGKKSIADAIVGKGVDATKNDDFSTLADKISKIKTGYGVGEEVSDENVEEIKTFHMYENESDYEVSRKKLEYSKFRGPVVECGEPSALVVGSLGRPFVATSSGEVLSFNRYLIRYYVSYEGYPVTAMSIRPNNELYIARESYSKIYRNGIGFFDKTDKLDAGSWSVDIGAKPINVMTPKYYYLYCGVGNKVVEVDNGFKKSWEFTEHTAQVNAVAVDKYETEVKDWNVYSGGADNKVFKISPEGKKVWEFTLHTGAVNAIAVDDEGYVYSGGADCTLYKISPDGKKVWENKTNNEITAIAIPPDGGVMVGTTGSTLYTFEFDGTPGESEEIMYGDENGKVVTDGDVVDIVVANDASIFMVTKKEKMIYKMKYGEYKKSYKIIK